MWGSVKVAIAVCYAAQHATPYSTAQNPCSMQHNATQVYHIPSVVLVSTWGTTLWRHFGVVLVITAILGLIDLVVIFKV